LPGGGGAGDGLPGAARGRGGDEIAIDIELTAIAPVTIVSPDRKTVIDIWVKEEGGSLLQVKVIDTESGDEIPVKAAVLPGVSFFLIDPAASFVSNDAAILAWTAPAVPVDDMPAPGEPGYLEAFNANARGAEVHVMALVKHPPNMAAEDWVLFELGSDGRNVALIDDDFGSQAEWGVDGKASVAGDLAAGEALVAWVRYDDDYMIQDGTTPTHVPCGGDGQPPCPICGGGTSPGDPIWHCKYAIVQVPNYRFQMEKTAIYVRRAGYRIEEIEGKVIYPEVRADSFKISPPGINIEPCIATSPSGAKSYCVWVHDPIHTNLINSNLGRQILCAVYTKNSADLDDPGQWSTPDGVLEMPDDYPALLEPEIVLSGDDEGLLVFTAIEKGASERDSGLGGNRFLFASRLEGGVFGTPFKVHGKCYKREYGYEQSFHHHIPDLVDPMNQLKWKNPEWVMVFDSLGLVGTPSRSGQVMATTLTAGSNRWSAPMNLTPDGRMHSNVASSMSPMGLHTIHLDSGLASMRARMAAAARGGLVAEERRFVVKDTPILPDPAIVGLLPDFPYASPGSTVKIVVEVENRGLRGTPVNKADGSSALGVQLSYVDDAGRTTLAALATIPEIDPGETESVPVDVEMPMDPTRLRAELQPGPYDGNLENNVEEISLGAPAPTDFACEPIYHTSYDGDGEVLDGLAVQLSWSNPAIYDEILLYRDGRLFASAPGRARRWIDRQTGSGTHTYEIRGRVLVSKSARASCTLAVVPPSNEGFFRGDSDGSGVLDITDPIYLLSHLFLGGKAPACPDAADADDNGTLDITDGILVLSYLYLGGKAPAAPGPRTCGKDPTPDLLPGCNTICP
jgi:hypothetical protein